MTDIIGTFVDFEGMRAAFKLRKNDLRLTTLELDDLAGLQTGYSSKLLCGMKRPGDMSLPALLGALGCELALIPSRARHRAQSHIIHGKAASRAKKNMSDLGRAGGLRSMRKKTKEELRRHQSRAAKARWTRFREKRRVAAASQPSVKEISSETMSALL